VLRDGIVCVFGFSARDHFSHLGESEEEIMEFQQVLGIRRSIRYFEPKKPVEQEKIRRSSRPAASPPAGSTHIG
jgi:hypothetical protein